MFTGNEDMEATALREQGWSISAITRHLGRDRRTIRAHLIGTRVVGERRQQEPDGFEPFVAYLRERLGEDPHVWATALYDERLAPLRSDCRVHVAGQERERLANDRRFD